MGRHKIKAKVMAWAAQNKGKGNGLGGHKIKAKLNRLIGSLSNIVYYCGFLRSISAKL